MPDKKLTDSEIKKGLECMLGIRNNDIEYQIDCLGCAFDNDGLCHENCSEGIAKATLDLINRLQAENERLENVVEYKQGIIDVLFTDNAKLLAKQSEIQATATTNMLRNMEAAIETAKAEAYKEFAELVQGEIDDALHSNYNAKEERYEKCKKHGIPIDAEDSFLMYCDGKIHALSGLQSFVSNTLKELVGDKNEM